jgi:hypothetical protein
LIGTAGSQRGGALAGLFGAGFVAATIEQAREFGVGARVLWVESERLA